MDSLRQELKDVESQGLLRSLRRLDSPQGPEISLDGRRLLNFCSNDYLGLAADPRLREAAAQAAERFGSGSGAARLVSGNFGLAEELESELARFKQTEAALLFNSGYHANIGLIPALAGAGDRIFSDDLNHASLIDGCRLSRAEKAVYRHNDLDHLESLLKVSACLRGRRLIVTEALFSMEGDLCPLPGILGLAGRYGAWVFLDEAHAVGVFGEHGRGLVSYFEDQGETLDTSRLISMGTLGKAFGSYGAFVAGSKTLRDFLINKARSFIFTTALPPAVLAASLAAVRIVETEEWRRERLMENVAQVRRSGLVRGGGSPIFSLVFGGSPQATMKVTEKLLEDGVFVQGIRPPSVPPGTSRLRVTVTATHTAGQIEQLLASLAALEQAAA